MENTIRCHTWPDAVEAPILTHGGMHGYFAEFAKIETVGIYIKGFKECDIDAEARLYAESLYHY